MAVTNNLIFLFSVDIYYSNKLPFVSLKTKYMWTWTSRNLSFAYVHENMCINMRIYLYACMCALLPCTCILEQKKSFSLYSNVCISIHTCVCLFLFIIINVLAWHLIVIHFYRCLNLLHYRYLLQIFQTLCLHLYATNSFHTKVYALCVSRWPQSCIGVCNSHFTVFKTS